MGQRLPARPKTAPATAAPAMKIKKPKSLRPTLTKGLDDNDSKDDSVERQSPHKQIIGH
jgi:hypothetical protein